MKIKILFSTISIFFLTILLAGSVNAQSKGSLQGFVKDNQGNALPGANIIVVQLISKNVGASADENGFFTISSIPEGTYSIRASYIGYQTKVEEVNIESGQTTKVNLVLNQALISGKEITVYGKLTQGKAQAINLQKNAPNIVNVVDEKQFEVYPDENIAGSLQRLSGIAITRDQGQPRYVQVRGMSQEFNSVQVEGIRIPSMNRNAGRAVGLDIIPSFLVNRIEVSKTLTPDMNANALGGMINLVTKAATEPSLEFKLTGGYNNQETRLTNWGKGLTSFAGKGGTRLFDNKFGVYMGASYYNTNRGSLFRSWRFTNDTGQDLRRHRETDYDSSRERWGFASHFDYKINSKNSFDLIINHDSYFGNEIRRLAIYNFDSNVESRFTGNRTRKQYFNLVKFVGNHQLNRVKVNYFAAWAKGKEKWPRITEFQFSRQNQFGDLSYQQKNNLNVLTDFPDIQNVPLTLDYVRVYPTFTHTRNYVGALNISVPITSGEKSIMKFGGRLKAGDRGKQLSFNQVTPADPNNTAEIRGGEFGFVNKKWGDPEVSALNLSSSLDPGPASENNTTYTAAENVYAGYIMNTTNWTSKLKSLLGVRLEHTYEDFTQVATNLQGSGKYTTILPSAQFTYQLSPSYQLRVAYSKALSRPSYSDLVPVNSIDYSSNEISRGNPKLKPITAQNFDLMFAHYTNQLGVLNVGVFYKHLKDPIATQSFQEVVDGTNFLVFQPQNGGTASVVGLEVSINQRLAALGVPLLNWFSIDANYTYNHSKTDFGGEESQNYPLPFNATHTANLSLKYENTDNGLTAVLTGNYRDFEFEKFEGSQLHHDIWLQSTFHLGFSANLEVSKHFSLFTNLNNLTNSPHTEIQGKPSQPYARRHEDERYSFVGQVGLKLKW